MAEPPRTDSGQATVHLLDRFKAGDDQALDQLYGRYYDRMVAVVRLRMGTKLRAKMESMDVVQEAFLASLNGLKTFSYRGEGAFFHWLCKVIENRIRDLVERFGAQKRDPAKEVPLWPGRSSAESVFGPISDLAVSASPASEAALREETQRLEKAIDTLSEQQREALLLVRYEQLAFDEAASVMGKTPDAVRMLVGRAIVALAKSLGVVSS